MRQTTLRVAICRSYHVELWSKSERQREQIPLRQPDIRRIPLRFLTFALVESNRSLLDRPWTHWTGCTVALGSTAHSTLGRPRPAYYIQATRTGPTVLLVCVGSWFSAPLVSRVSFCGFDATS